MNEEPETPNLPEPSPPDPIEATPESLIGEKPEESEAPAEPEPEFVPLTAEDIQISEDLKVSDEDRDSFLGILNNQELDTKGKAQALIDLQTKVAQAGAETLTQSWADTQKEWQAEVKADEVVGGANHDKVISGINQLVEQHGSQELIEVLAATGAGNNIHVIRFLNNVANIATEGSLATGGPANAPVDRASILFPSMEG